MSLVCNGHRLTDSVLAQGRGRGRKTLFSSFGSCEEVLPCQFPGSGAFKLPGKLGKEREM